MWLTLFIFFCSHSLLLHTPSIVQATVWHEGFELKSVERTIHTITNATFCIDPKVVDIFAPRIDKCLGGKSVAEELEHLRSSSAFHFQHSHELFAYQYFLVSKSNKLRRLNCDEADFEYVPLLPLSWKLEFPVNTLCTAGDICPQQAPSGSSSHCSAANIIADILQYVSYITTKRGVPLTAGPPRFIVTGAFNFKTIMGRGLSMDVRRGDEYERVSSFVESTILGHYERLVQCADLLRKPWRYVVEMPFVTTMTSTPITLSRYQRPNKLGVPDILFTHKESSFPTQAVVQPVFLKSPLSVPRKVLMGAEGNISFFFAGRMYLWGSERVCSVRIAMLQLLNRSDAIIVDITPSQSEGPVLLSNTAYYHTMAKSDFCLIARSDSHTTASLFEAISSLCIPVVVSDWYVFPYRWWVPYTEFVVRISEIDFLSDPNAVLDHIKISYSVEQIGLMKKAMLKWRKYTEYEPRGDDQQHEQKEYYSSGLDRNTDVIYPLELLLLEMQRALTELAEIPMRNPKVKPGDISKLGPTGPVLCLDPLKCFPAVKPLNMKGVVKDNRNHLCKQVTRLIGKYKIVYFLQCVRMFWTLRPGLMKPVDDAIAPSEKEFVYRFHNLTYGGTRFITQDVYPDGVNGNTADNSLDSTGRLSVYGVGP